MKVSDLMKSNVITAPPEMSAAEAARMMQREDVGILPICDRSGQLRGVLTDRDIVTRCVAARNDPTRIQIGDLMTKKVCSISPGEDLHAAAQLMAGEQIRRLPVLEQDRLVGMLSLADLAHSDFYGMEAAQALTEITDRLTEY